MDIDWYTQLINWNERISNKERHITFLNIWYALHKGKTVRDKDLITLTTLWESMTEEERVELKTAIDMQIRKDNIKDIIE